MKKLRTAALAAGVDVDDAEEMARFVEERADSAASSSLSPSSKKKKKLLSGQSLPEPPVHPASQLDFGLRTLDVLHELFDVIRIRLTGFKKPIGVELDWSSETKLGDLLACCEVWYKWQAFLVRYGSRSGLPACGTDAAVDDASVAPSTPSSASSASVVLPSSVVVGPPSNGRMSCAELRPLFLKESSGDPNAVWLQRQLAGVVKKAKETLAADDQRELATKLQQHAEYWIRQYPVQKEATKEKKIKR